MLLQPSVIVVPFKARFQSGRASLAVWAGAASTAFPSLPLSISLASFNTRHRLGFNRSHEGEVIR